MTRNRVRTAFHAAAASQRERDVAVDTPDGICGGDSPFSTKTQFSGARLESVPSLSRSHRRTSRSILVLHVQRCEDTSEDVDVLDPGA